MKNKISLITPPFVQPNTPYPATAYLTGYLKRGGYSVSQYDLSVELLCDIFSADFMTLLFANFEAKRGETEDDNILRIHTLRKRYITTVETIMTFLQGRDSTLANLICTPDFLPQASRFDEISDLEEAFGELGIQDCARYIATLYLQDISDFIRATVTPHFEIVRYAEQLSLSVPMFSALEEQLAAPLNLIEERMVELLHAYIIAEQPDYVGFTIPFPGNLLASLRCAQYLKKHFPHVKTIAGGGYPTTELRSMSDKGIFAYFDYIVLDDGEIALERIMSGGELINTYTSAGYNCSSKVTLSHKERGCPDFGGLPHTKYFSLFEVTNAMHKLWGDGRWNKMTLAHGCYWAKCAFCDTTLDYIGCYDAVPATILVDWMEDIAAQTGSRGFHFTDEAASPKLLKEISLELLRRGLIFSWWTNVRFEAAFTGDLCRLMATAGCIAVSGGLEVANDRLLKMINKGITIETATITLRNFYYTGIMTHTYLMYGLPTQTLAESVDVLEVVRQMFIAELINSAFWHRYAMTVHSPSGQTPEMLGVRRKNAHVNTFANNEVYFVEDRGYNINLVGDGLRDAVANYVLHSGLERSVHQWFAGKIPSTTVENTLIVDHLIKPDSSRIFSATARLVWIGDTTPERTEAGILIHTASQEKPINFSNENANFMVEIMVLCADLSRVVLFSEIENIYKKHTQEPFSTLYHSKKWDQLREFGLLQI